MTFENSEISGELLSAGGLRRALGLTDYAIRKLERADNRFPKRISGGDGNHGRWRRDEVEAYVKMTPLGGVTHGISRWAQCDFYVYVLSAGEYVKIGLAQNVKGRIHSIQTDCPLPVSVQHVAGPMTRYDARAIEVGAHELLASYWVKGEWFRSCVPQAIEAVTTAGVFA